MPWPPGLVPVANVDQATGVWAGRVVATRRIPPCSFSRARFGSWPASSSRETISGLSPSRPMTMTFLMAPSTGRDPRSRRRRGGNQGSSSALGLGLRHLLPLRTGPDAADQAAAEPDDAAAEHHEDAHDPGDHGGHGHHHLGADVSKEHFQNLGWSRASKTRVKMDEDTGGSGPILTKTGVGVHRAVGRSTAVRRTGTCDSCGCGSRSGG